jgi:hypothetical protein
MSELEMKNEAETEEFTDELSDELSDEALDRTEGHRMTIPVFCCAGRATARACRAGN